MNPPNFTDVHTRGIAPADSENGRASAERGKARTPLTGRDTEVALLTNRWEQAKEGMGQVVLLVGEAGLGKSRLVKTIQQHVLAELEAPQNPAHSAGSSIIEWRCSDRFRSTGLYPITDHLQRHFRFAPSESPQACFDRLAEYLEECGLDQPEAVSLFAKLLFLPVDERFPASGLTPSRERQETFRVIREWLRARSRRQPILFILEDLHWIDASTLEFVEEFIAEGLHECILTVLTFRPEFQTPWPAVAHQTSLALNRLTRRQVKDLINRDAEAVLPDSLVTQIYQRTSGIPLLVEEFSRMIRELSISERTLSEEMPSTLQELVMARLERLAGDREVAHLAAMLGREFSYEMLAAVVSTDEPALEAELSKLVSAEILFPTGRPPRCNYLFKHSLLEEALRTALDEARQRELHQRVAETIETRFQQAAETQPELLALHYTEAGLWDKAVGYWLRAGLRSHERCANVEAIDHFTKGLDLLQRQPDSPARDLRELEILGPLGAARIAAQGYAAPEVGPLFERAQALTESLGPSPQAFVMLRGLFAFHIVRGNFRYCAELAKEAVQLAERLDDPGLWMEALFLDGITRLYRGDFARASESFANALAEYDDRARTAYWAARTGEDSGVAHRCYLALACWHLGYPDRALSLNREARELARTLHHPFSLGYALHHTGWLHQHCRLAMQTQAAGEEQIQMAEEQGFVFWKATGSLYAAAGLLLREELEEGLPVFQTGLAAYRATGANLGLPYYLGILGEAFTQAGRFDEAHRALGEALALVEANDERFHEAELHRLVGELHLAENREETLAEASFRHAIEIAQRHRSHAWELRASASLARLWQQQGRSDEARMLLAAVLTPFTEGFATPDVSEAAELLETLNNDRMRTDIAAGLDYVRRCIPAPFAGAVSIDWRYIPSSSLGGDTIGYNWVDDNHLALYIIDVTGHGLDSALLSVTIINVIRSGALAGADMRRPEEVLAALNDAFQGSEHGYKYFTLWYGVYDSSNRMLTYASGGHPSAVAIAPSGAPPLLFPATGPMMGISRGMRFPAESAPVPSGARLFIFTDGVFEVRRDFTVVSDLTACVSRLSTLCETEANVMDALLAHVRELRGSIQLEDDFSIIEARLH